MSGREGTCSALVRIDQNDLPGGTECRRQSREVEAVGNGAASDDCNAFQDRSTPSGWATMLVGSTVGWGTPKVPETGTRSSHGFDPDRPTAQESGPYRIR